MDRWPWSSERKEGDEKGGAISLVLVAILFLSIIAGRTWAAPAAQSNLEVIDDRGEHIVLRAPAKRVIALYGAFNEILASLGAEGLIVARTKADSLPPTILSLPVIGTHMRPNVELILSLNPDLILQATGRSRALEPVRALERAGLRVAVFDMNSISGLMSSIKRIGRLVGRSKAASVLVAHMEAAIQSLAGSGHHRRGPRPKVFFEVRYPNLLGAGGNNIVNEVIELAGGENCFSGVAKKFVRPNLEAVIDCDPDYYIIQKGPMNPNPGDPRRRPGFMLLRAIRSGHWEVVPEGLFSRPTPRIIDAIRELYDLLEHR